MKGTAKNNKGKIERNNKIKEGNCIFPFTYKRKIHKECFPTHKGPICATEINPKTGVLSKYGYCTTDNLGKGTVEKALTPEKQKTIKLKSMLFLISILIII
jgi:hypothetical protein